MEITPELYAQIRVGINEAKTLCEIVVTPEHRFVLTTEQVEGTIRALMKCREQMQPIAMWDRPDNAAGFAAGEINPRFTADAMPDGTLAVAMRFGAFGWAVAVFPQQQAEYLAAKVQEAAARLAPKDLKH